MAQSPSSSRRERAFTLIEILIVLVIVGVLIAMALALTRGISAGQKRSMTINRLAGAEAALIQFVMQARRLPCPADGSIASGGVNAGVELRDTATQLCTLANQANGVLPWVSLGLPEVDATDGWDRRLTYRAHPSLVGDNSMDMSQCDPAGTGPGPAAACTPGCLSTNLAGCTPPHEFLRGKGFRVQNIVGGVLMNPLPLVTTPPIPATGAAYVMLSAGESGGNAFLNTGRLSTTSTDDGNEEKDKNYANRALQPYYVDDSISDVAGANHFDDLVSRPSVLAVITKAALGPRSH